MSTICTICARAGSKGVAGKNLRILHGRPLIAWTIEQALEHPEINRVYVSTDSDEIAEVAASYGAVVPFKRPAALATDQAAKLPVILHLVDWIVKNEEDFSWIIDLDPTSPLRKSIDISECLRLLKSGASNVITGYPSDKNPYFNMVEKDEEGKVTLSKGDGKIVARQAAPRVYSLNASIYCWHKDTLENGVFQDETQIYVMPRDRSVDIDDELDYKVVELLMKERIQRE